MNEALVSARASARRRRHVGLLALVAAAGLAGCGGSPAPGSALPRHLLYVSTLSAEQSQRTLEALRETLVAQRAQLGLVQVHSLQLDANEQDERVLSGQVHAALQQRPHAMVFAATLRVARVSQNADAAVPIVFEAAGDPRTGCVADSLTRPGRSATGYTSYSPSAGKVVEALTDAYPSLREVVILVDGQDLPPPPCGQAPPTASRPPCRAGYDAGAPAGSVADMATAATQAGLRWRTLRVCAAADLPQLPRWLPTRGKAAPTVAVLVPMHYLFHTQPAALTQALAASGLPAVYPRHHYLRHGGLMSVAPTTQAGAAEHPAALMGRVLAGEPPARLPVQTPEGFELGFNVQAAHEQGLPPSARVWTRVARMGP